MRFLKYNRDTVLLSHAIAVFRLLQILLDRRVFIFSLFKDCSIICSKLTLSNTGHYFYEMLF